VSALSAALPAAHAQTDATVVVTGTRAKDRTVLTSAVPIDVLTAEDLQRAAGADGNLAAALQTLLPSFNFPRQSNSSGADHVRAAQLRGLSPDQVLVLVNGKRRHIAAVVNIDSKIGKGTNPVDFNSIPLNAIKRVVVLRDGAGAQYGSDAIAGVINVILDDVPQGGEFEASLGTHYTHFDPTGQRITDGQTADLRAKAGIAFGDGGFVRFGAELGSHRATNRSGFDDVAAQIGAGFVDDTTDNRALQGQRNFRPGEPEVKGLNLWANSGFKLGAGADGYAFATYDRRNSVGSAFFRYPDSSANVKSVYPNGFRPETTGTNQDLSLAGGAKGALGGDWFYDASLSYGRNDFDYGLRQSINASLGAASPTSFDLGTFHFNQLGANADFTRDVRIDGLAAPLTLALGAEARREAFRTEAGDPASYTVGGFAGDPGAQAGPGLQPGDAADLSRSIVGAYVDFGGDLTKTLFSNIALRYDHYSDFGNASTAKLSARWAFIPGAALRAAVSNNFRAPSLAQSGSSFTITGRGEGGALTQIRLLPVGNAVAQSLGAQPLKAEKSRNLSAGFTLQPARDTSLSIDAYRIDIDDRITLSQRFAVGADSFNFFTNAIDTRTEGIDLVASHTARLDAAELQLSWASSYTRTKIRKLDPAAGVGLEEINTLTDAPPHQRHVFSALWRQGAWSWLGRLTRQGETTRVFDFGGGFTPTQTYGATWQLDLEGEYRFDKQLSVALGAVNIGDTYPTRSIDDISYFGNLPYDVLSPIGFNGATYYAKLRYTF
jgi:iron complex outermembrane receptor protein